MEVVAETGIGTGVIASSSAVELRFTPLPLDVRSELVLESGRRRFFDALLHVSAWWPHRVRPGTNIVLEPRVGGRLFEHCDDGCGILLGHVARLVTPEEFAVEGSLGIETPISALWTVRLDADGHHRTFLHGHFEAFGAIDEATRAGAAAYWETTYAALGHYLDA
jgi:hypothetical protein